MIKFQPVTSIHLRAGRVQSSTYTVHLQAGPLVTSIGNPLRRIAHSFHAAEHADARHDCDRAVEDL